jgi:hypothetical protein
MSGHACEEPAIRLIFHNMKIQKDRLTERQKLFCEHYVGVGRHNAALSARLAGYAAGSSHVTGCQLLQQPKIAATVKGLEEAVASDMEVTRQIFLQQLQEAAAMAKLQCDPAGMLNAWKTIGMACGFFKLEAKRVEVSTAGEGARARIEAMSDKQLLALIAQGAAAG